MSQLDSFAPAAFLIDEGEISFEFSNNEIYLLKTVRALIKVYNDDGVEFGDFKLPLYRDGSDREKLMSLKGRTYNLEGGDIVESDLHKKKDVFEEKVSENHRSINFAMPNVKAGSVFEVIYTISSPFWYQIDRWYFQYKVPVEYGKYTIIVPEYFTYTPVPKGYLPMKASKKELNSLHGEVSHIFEIKDVPPYKEDDYVLNDNDYRCSIKYELYSTYFKNGNVNYYSKSWKEIGDNLLESPRFGKELRRKHKEAEGIIKDALTLQENERLPFMYNYVQSNFIWNKDFGKSRWSKEKDIFETKSGSIGYINLLLLNLLNKAGVEAHPLVMKSRGNGLLNESFPTITDLNYLVAYVKMGDGFLLVDATDKFTPLGLLPNRATNINGVLIKEGSSQVIKIKNPNRYKVSTMSNYTLEDSDFSLVGSAARKYADAAAVSFRKNLSNENEVSNEEEAEQESDEEEEYSAEDEDYGAEEEESFSDEYEVTLTENLDDINLDVKIEYDETLRESIKKIGNSIYINSCLDFGMDKNPFTEESRDFPIYYLYKLDRKTVATINIPDNYIIESVPEDVKMALPEKKGSFSYRVTQEDNSLVIYYFFKLTTDSFRYDEYPSLKEFYNLIIEKGKEKIVLTKKS